MAELGKLFAIDSNPNAPQVEEEMMDFEYVRNCKDPSLLKAILMRLQTGADGHYPDLMKATEAKLLELLPSKDRKRLEALGKSATVEEVRSAEEDLAVWQRDIASKDKAIRGSRGDGEIFSVPSAGVPVRGMKGGVTLPVDGYAAQSRGAPKSEDTDAKRISGYDFRAWEKFDVDAAVSAVEGEEQGRAEDVRRAKNDLKHERSSADSRRQTQHAAAMSSLRADLGWSNISETARAMKSDRERLKGNECFKAKDYQEAFDCYSRSLALSESSTAYANRAMAGIKLDRFEVSIDDCTRALALDPAYSKAQVRRGMARTCIGQYALAIEDFLAALAVDPGNAELLKCLAKAKAKYADTEGREYGEAARLVEGAVAECQSEEALVRELAGYEYLYGGACETGAEADRSAAALVSSGFTRIAISEEDEDEEEEEEEEGGKEEGKEGEGAKEDPVDAFARLSEMADNLDGGGMHSELAALLGEALRDAPSLSGPQRAALGQRQVDSLLLLRRQSEAVEACDAALDADPSAAWALLARAEAHRLSRAFSSMRADVARAMELSPASEKGKGLLAWLAAESDRLKDTGNSAAGISDTEEALRLYSLSLEADPSNIRSRNNRSQMLLKLGRFEECFADTQIVLERDATNVKALFRGAQACEGLSKFEKAAGFYDRILAAEPANASASINRKKLDEKLKSVKSASIRETHSEENAVEAEESVEKPTKPASSSSLSAKVAKKLQGISLKAKEPEVPSAPPTTVYELERVWRGLRGRADLFALYLLTFKKATFKKVFKETISHEIIGSVFLALKDYVSDDEQTLFILEGFSNVNKMDMTMALLPSEYVDNLRAVVTRLESGSSTDVSIARIAALKVLFHL